MADHHLGSGGRRTLGVAYALTDRADEALPLVAGAVEEFRRRPGHVYPGLIDLCDAERSYREALTLAGELGMRPLIAHCHHGLRKLYRRTGSRDHAHEHLTTATTMYREMGMTYWLEKAEAELGVE